MNKGEISVYYGSGKGKTCVALGRGLKAIGDNLKVVMIRFLDYHSGNEAILLKKLEPDFRIFNFEKIRGEGELSPQAKLEVIAEVRNAFNFSKKIVDTGECEMLILDGILECVAEGYLLLEELIEILEKRPDFMDIILTGNVLQDEIAKKAECVYKIIPEK